MEDAPRIGSDIPWWTVDAGGGVSTGESGTLEGTVGQIDAFQMTGDGLILHGGFWSATDEEVFADDFESGDISGWS